RSTRSSTGCGSAPPCTRARSPLSRPLFTPAGMRTADALLGLFRLAGFSTEQAVLRYQQVPRYLLALVMLETGSGPELSGEERRERARVARITFETLPPDQYPHLVEAAPELAFPFDPERAFESGLDPSSRAWNACNHCGDRPRGNVGRGYSIRVRVR